MEKLMVSHSEGKLSLASLQILDNPKNMSL